MYFLVLLGMGCEGVGRVFSCGKRMIVNKSISEIKCKMGRGERERERERKRNAWYHEWIWNDLTSKTTSCHFHCFISLSFSFVLIFIIVGFILFCLYIKFFFPTLHYYYSHNNDGFSCLFSLIFNFFPIFF